MIQMTSSSVRITSQMLQCIITRYIPSKSPKLKGGGWVYTVDIDIDNLSDIISEVRSTAFVCLDKGNRRLGSFSAGDILAMTKVLMRRVLPLIP